MRTRYWFSKVFVGLVLSAALAGCGGDDDDNNTPPPTPKVSFSTGSQSVAEDVGAVPVTVQVSPASASAITVPVTVSGTATSGSDFTAPAASVTIPANATSATFNVAVTNDTANEGAESIVLTLGTPSSGGLGTTTAQTITIAASDGSTGGGSVVSMASATTTSAEDAGTVNVTVTVSPASTSAITVPYTVTGTATGGGTDYTIPASPLTIPANATSATIPVAIVNDTATEGDETVIITLGTPTGATLGTSSTHTLTISANDNATSGARTITIDPSASAPADLSTPAAAAKFGAAIAAFSNAASSTGSGGGGTGKSGSTKAAQNCPAGGTQDVSSSGATTTVTYEDCKPDTNTLLDGVFSTVTGACTPPSASCIHSDVSFGTASETFLTEKLGPAGQQRRNLLFGTGTSEAHLNGTTVDQVNGLFDLQGAHINTSRSDQPRIDYRIGNASQKFEVEVHIASDHSTDSTFEGPFRVSGACGSGQGNVTTPTAIHTNPSGQTTSGQIMVTAGSASATYTYNADGSVTVSTAGGTQTFTAAQLDAQCNID